MRAGKAGNEEIGGFMAYEDIPMSRLLDDVAIMKGGCRPAFWEAVVARGEEASGYLLGKMGETDGDDIPRIARVLLKLMYDGRFEKDSKDIYIRRMVEPGFVVPYELAVSIHSRVKEKVGEWRSTLEPAGLGDSTAAGLELKADEYLEKAERIMWEDVAFGIFEEAREKGFWDEERAKAHITNKMGERKSGETTNPIHLDTLARFVCTYVKNMQGRYSRVQMAMSAQNMIGRAGECCKALELGAKNAELVAEREERKFNFDVDGLILTRAVQSPFRAEALEAGGAIVDELLERMERQVESKRIWIPKDARMMDTDGYSTPVNENPYEIGTAILNLCYDGRYLSDRMHERRMGTFKGVLPYDVSMRAAGGIIGWMIKREAEGLPETELMQVRIFMELADNTRRNLEQMNYEYMALQLALSFTQVNVREMHIIEGHLARMLERMGGSVTNAARGIARYAGSMDYAKRTEQVPLIAMELRLLNFNRDDLGRVRLDIGIVDSDSKAAETSRADSVGARGRVVEKKASPAARLVAQLSQGGLEGLHCHQLVGMGMVAADELIGTFPQPNAGNKLQMAKVMVGIAAKNPSEAKSVEMMGLVGEWLSRKKPKGKKKWDKDKSGRDFAELRQAYADAARKMGIDEKKAMPKPGKKKGRREKKGKRNLNVN